MPAYEAVIGLEVHAQLATASKLFCSCPNKFGCEPNENVCIVCAGMPGALPALNKKAVEYAAKTGMALNCTVNAYSVFARKSYFYPDLPAGYQTSQYDPPICVNGHLDIVVDGAAKSVGITRIHMEDDAGKNIHPSGSSVSLLDLNRAGTPLIEIVSEPDLRSPEEAVAFMRQLRAILLYLGVCDGNMEEGSLRCDANVSIRPKGSAVFGTRVEIKNLNSFRHVQRAISYEIERQKDCLAEGAALVRETRLYDSVKHVTQSMRAKEEAHDYRYFPNPDLPPVVIAREELDRWQRELPELPPARCARFMTQYGLPEQDAALLTGERDLADFFEDASRAYPQPKRIANLMQGELLRELHARNATLAASPMTPADLAGLAKIIDSGLISIKIAHDIFGELFEQGGSAEALVNGKGLGQISDAGELDSLVAAVVADHPEEAAALRGGKTKLTAFFVGQVMRKTGGKANPALVNALLEKYLR